MQTNIQQNFRHVQNNPVYLVQAQTLQALLQSKRSIKIIHRIGYAKMHSNHSLLLVGVLCAKLRSAMSIEFLKEGEV